MKKSKRPKASKRKGGMDLISNMPDHILLLILSRLPSTEEVIRTSVLSSRWRYLWTSVPCLEICFSDDDDDTKNELRKNGFQEFVFWVLANKSVDLDSLNLCCFGHYSMSTVGQWIHIAVTRNVNKLDLTFFPKNESDEYEYIKLPHCLVTCCSLKVLKLCLFERGLILPNFKGFPALRVLELSYVDLLNDEDLVKSFLESCPLREDLSLISCFMNGIDLLYISCSKLKKLKIVDDAEERMCNGIKICCPKLVFLELTGPTADNFFFESLDSLKEAVIDPEEIPPATEVEFTPTYVLFPGISYVESLRITFTSSVSINAECDPTLPNLKTLALTTTIADFTMDDLNRILNYYPNLESLKLIVKELFSIWEEGKMDEAETENLWNSDLEKVQFIDYNGERPKLGLEHCSQYGFEFMGLVFSWGDKAKCSHYRS